MELRERAQIRERLRVVQERLEPDAARTWALSELNDMFRAGRAPDPLPQGLLKGRFITLSVWGPLDSVAHRIASLWMPWLGKSFDPAAMQGVNVLTKNARKPIRVLWPGHVPQRELVDRLEAFPFRNRIAPGELDPDVDVLKIDYDFDANPDFLIRRILDELVEVEDGLYLGKILFRRSGSWMPIGFFTLER